MTQARGKAAAWVFASLTATTVLVACSTNSGSGPLDDGDSGSSDDGTGASSGSTTGSSTGSSTGSTTGSSTGSSTGSTTGSSSGNPVTHDAGSSPDAALVCGTQVSNNVMFDGTGGIVCGTDCDLTKNTCCVDGLGDAKCVNGHSGCGSFGNIGGAAQFQCVQISDCPSGQVCCGYADSSSNLAGSKCQDISANGNKCAPAPTGTMGSVQFCQKTCECKDGSACVAQSCTVMGAPNAMLTMCALQDKAPYNCTPQ